MVATEATMTHIYLLLILCNGLPDCQPYKAGYYRTEQACAIAGGQLKPLSKCKMVLADTD